MKTKYKISKETRQKMSTNNARFWLNKNRSEITKKKISLANKGKKKFFSLPIKKCRLCQKFFKLLSSNQFLCGSIQKKLGCSWKNKLYHNKERVKKIMMQRTVNLCKKCQKLKTYFYNKQNRRYQKCLSCKPFQPKMFKKLKLRFTILKKFNFTCQYCGRKPPETTLEIDHIFPKSKGGNDNIENLTIACKECNLGKRDILLSHE